MRAALRIVGDTAPVKTTAVAQIIDEEFTPAIDALKKYKTCRHGSPYCFCTKEAKTVLFGVND